MSKSSKARKAAAAASAPSATASATPASAPASKPAVVSKVVGVLQVKAGQNFRGARAAWYAVLQAYDGKPAQTYLEETAKVPPSLPKSGRAENPSGWLRYWVRTGVATIVQPKA